MPTANECIQKYGKEMWEKMRKTGWLDGITCELLPNGEIDIPERDIDIALRAARGEQIGEWEWD